MSVANIIREGDTFTITCISNTCPEYIQGGIPTYHEALGAAEYHDEWHEDQGDDLDPDNVEDAPCWTCKGSGRTWFGMRTCPTCGGEGVVEAEEDEDEDNPYAEADRLQAAADRRFAAELEAADAAGDLVNHTPNDACDHGLWHIGPCADEGDYDAMETCPTCNGTGVAEGTTCPSCRGAGQLTPSQVDALFM